MMAWGAVGLALGLTTIGAIGGWVTGEAVLGNGSGLLVAVVGGSVGLILAWALWSTRPAARLESVPPPADLPAVPHPQGHEQTARKQRAERPRISITRADRRGGDRPEMGDVPGREASDDGTNR